MLCCDEAVRPEADRSRLLCLEDPAGAGAEISKLLSTPNFLYDDSEGVVKIAVNGEYLEVTDTQFVVGPNMFTAYFYAINDSGVTEIISLEIEIGTEAANSLNEILNEDHDGFEMENNEDF